MDPLRAQGLLRRRGVEGAEDLLCYRDRRGLADEAEDATTVGDFDAEAPFDLAQVPVEEATEVGQAGVVLREELEVQGVRVG
jgi:hypothetical protein